MVRNQLPAQVVKILISDDILIDKNEKENMAIGSFSKKMNYKKTLYHILVLHISFCSRKCDLLLDIKWV